jgi:hypothetical protein
MRQAVAIVKALKIAGRLLVFARPHRLQRSNTKFPFGGRELLSF